jgi:hypothetical protein
MYVYVCKCMYVYMHVSTNVCMYACVCVCVCKGWAKIRPAHTNNIYYKKSYLSTS